VKVSVGVVSRVVVRTAAVAVVAPLVLELQAASPPMTSATVAAAAKRRVFMRGGSPVVERVEGLLSANLSQFFRHTRSLYQMSVKLRLTRVGKTKQPQYRIVATDSRSPRDGRFIEIVGQYNPRAEPSVVTVDNAKVVKWLMDGAQPTDRVKKLLEISGAWSDFGAARAAAK
jgi:small subunit ribosomal protein S16